MNDSAKMCNSWSHWLLAWFPLSSVFSVFPCLCRECLRGLGGDKVATGAYPWCLAQSITVIPCACAISPSKALQSSLRSSLPETCQQNLAELRACKYRPLGRIRTQCPHRCLDKFRQGFGANQLSTLFAAWRSLRLLSRGCPAAGLKACPVAGLFNHV